MSKKTEHKNIPELRFPEFVKEREWNIEPLGGLSEEIVEKTKGRKYKLMSITSGVGLISQIEKFGREIAGNSYKNYYVIQKYDFAYNKSSTKLYAEGEIAMYEDEHKGAVPNSIFTCFRFSDKLIYPIFAKYSFVNNIHGNWLRKFIAVGARAHGALQVNNKDLFSVPFPYPSLSEQQKIADCLSSLDEVIAAQTERLDVLKTYKKGLMQNLFPQEDEIIPKLRFPEFVNEGDWEEKTLGEIADISKLAGYEFTKHVIYEENGKLIALRGLNIRNNQLDLTNVKYIDNSDLSKLSRSKLVINDLLFTYIGTIGEVALIEENDKYYLAPNVSRIRITNSKIIAKFLLQFFNVSSFKEEEIAKYISSSSQPALTMENVRKFAIKVPTQREQQKIADFLSSLDDLITAQTQKIEQLKIHKKGLMQGLFPAANE